MTSQSHLNFFNKNSLETLANNVRLVSLPILGHDQLPPLSPHARDCHSLKVESSIEKKFNQKPQKSDKHNRQTIEQDDRFIMKEKKIIQTFASYSMTMIFY